MVSFVCMAFKFEELQPLSIKYFVLICGACEGTILSISDQFVSGSPLSVSKFLKNSGKK